MSDRERAQAREPEPEPERGGWSSYRWGILRALEQLAEDGKERAAAAALALQAAEKRLEDRICEAESSLGKAIAKIDLTVSEHDRDVSALKARAALLGAGAGLIFGAIAGAIAGRLIQ